MKANILTFVLGAVLATTSISSKAQTTAMSYDFIDCAGNSQSIYADLDAGKALILEFFMTSCSPCVTAGEKLEVMKADLLAEYPGMIKAYAFGYSNSYTCTAINNWVSSNSFTSIPSDSGATQVAYYGGMGMPTIVILGGGTSHSVLGSPYQGFSTSDTTTMANDIRNFLNSTGIKENNILSNFNLFPNPANLNVQLSFTLSEAADMKIDLYDITGRVVLNIADKKNQTGQISEVFNTEALAEGSYILRISTNGKVTQQKLNVIH